MSETRAIILAAGQSQRMKSELPKVLHKVLGVTMAEHVMNAVRDAGVQEMILVVGHKADEVQAALQHHSGVKFALQTERLGTGHAVMSAHDLLKDYEGAVLVLAGDTPLLTGKSLSGLLQALQTQQASCVVGTAQTENNFGLGRIVRDADGEFLRIVEQRDATPEEQLITEINTGCFAFNSADLFTALKKIRPNNAQGEYYLTDCVEILRNEGKRVVASCSLTVEEAMGVNTQDQLAEVEEVLKKRVS